MVIMKSSEKLRLAAICLAIAFAVGWIAIKSTTFGLWAMYLGIVGVIPFLLLNGVHGDMEGAPGVVGGFLFVLVNAAVYYGISVLILKLIRRRKRSA
jgi:hypothetical protein